MMIQDDWIKLHRHLEGTVAKEPATSEQDAHDTITR